MKLLSQGGHGCVYLTSLKCKTISTQDYVTKVQIQNSVTNREIQIGKMVSGIPDFASCFAPIVESCPVLLQQLDNSLTDPDGRQCKIIEKTENKTSLSMMKIPYIPNGDFRKHMKNAPFNELMACYRHLLMGISRLININIVHYDLKYDNILFNNRLNNPIIIDFGLSIDITNMVINGKVIANVTSILRRYFYSYSPEYKLWPLDVQLLCLIAKNIHNNKYEQLTAHELDDMCSKYKETAPRLSYNTEYYKAFAEQSYDTVAKQLLNGWKTWDLYAVNLMLYEHVSNNPYMKTLLETELNAEPQNRSSSTQIMDKILEIYYQLD